MDLEHLHSGIHFLLVFSAVFPTSTAKMLHHPLQSVCGCIRVYIGPHKPHVLEPQSISLPYLHALICIRHPRCQHHQQLQLLSGATPPEMAQNPSEGWMCLLELGNAGWVWGSHPTNYKTRAVLFQLSTPGTLCGFLRH